MSSANGGKMERVRITGARYRLARSVARLKFSSLRTRLLWPDRIGNSGRALLLVNSPPSMRTVGLLNAAFDRPLYWLLDSRLSAAAASFGAADLAGRSGAEPGLVEDCRRAFAAGGMTAVFAGSGEPGGQADGREIASRLGIELAKEAHDPLDVTIYPVHLFDPPRDSAGREALIFVGAPIYPVEHLHRADSDSAQAGRALAQALAESCASNPFRLPPPELTLFLKDLEGILRGDLKNEWAGRPGWQQDAQELVLSEFVARWIEQTNRFDPASIVALRERVEASRDSRQRWAARQFKSDTAGAWMSSSFRRTLVWLESTLGFPVALYGLANHLLAGGVYVILRRLQKSSGVSRDKWIAAGFGALAGYTIQVLLCNHWLGRATAGYYALTLPLSGAYLWRYSWLARNRTGRLFSRVLAPLALRRLQNSRQAVVRELDLRIANHSRSLGVPR